tara:strand:+ start:749 stop:1057 length:309 start_codon:yes stop_codon:yes gene_type:complete
MATTRYNISGELTQELLAAGDAVTVTSISFVNTHATASCTVDLYIEKCSLGKFYLLKGVDLPIGNTLMYDSVKFLNSTGEFGLYVKLNKSASETPAVDVIIQ